jgi:hypothetical protein
MDEKAICSQLPEARPLVPLRLAKGLMANAKAVGRRLLIRQFLQAALPRNALPEGTRKLGRRKTSDEFISGKTDPSELFLCLVRQHIALTLSLHASESVASTCLL